MGGSEGLVPELDIALVPPSCSRQRQSGDIFSPEVDHRLRAGSGRRKVGVVRDRNRNVAVRIEAAAGGVALKLAVTISLEPRPTGGGAGGGSGCSSSCSSSSSCSCSCPSGGWSGRSLRRWLVLFRLAVRIEPALRNIARRLTDAVTLKPGAAGGRASRGRGGGSGGCCCCWLTDRYPALCRVLVAQRVTDAPVLGVLAGPGAGLRGGGGGCVGGPLVVGPAVWLRGRGQPGLLGGGVAPPLDDGVGHPPGVSQGPGAYLLGDVHAGLPGLQLGHQLSHVLAGLPGLQGALLLRLIGGDRLRRLVALCGPGDHGAGAGTADLHRDLDAGGLRGVLGDRLLRDVTALDRPVGTLLHNTEELYYGHPQPINFELQFQSHDARIFNLKSFYFKCVYLLEPVSLGYEVNKKTW